MPSTEHSGALSAVSDLPQAEHVYVAVTGCATPGTRSSTTGTTSSSSRGCVKASRQSYGPLGGRPTWQTTRSPSSTTTSSPSGAAGCCVPVTSCRSPSADAPWQGRFANVASSQELQLAADVTMERKPAVRILSNHSGPGMVTARHVIRGPV